MQGNDLARALVALVADLETALLSLAVLGCYLAALALFVQGCLRLLRHSDGRGPAPSAAGTVLSFLLAAVMATLPRMIEAAGATLLGGDAPASRAALGYAPAGGGHDEVLEAVFSIVALAGLAAIVRGVLMLRAAADGKPGATGSRAALHLAGGVAAWHVLSVIDAVQQSLGIAVLDVS